MSFEQVEDNNDSTSDGDKSVVYYSQLLRHYFKIFCHDHGVKLSESVNVDYDSFFNWLRDQIAHAEPGWVYELRDHLQVPEEFVCLFQDIMCSERYLQVFTALWPRVVLYFRPNHVHKLSDIRLSAVFRWDDGKTFPISNFVFLNNNDQSVVNNDLATLDVLAEVTSKITSFIELHGTDILYTKAGVKLDDSQFQVLATALVKLTNGAQIKEPDGTAYDLPPEATASCMALLSMMQVLLITPPAFGPIVTTFSCDSVSTDTAETTVGGWS